MCCGRGHCQDGSLISRQHTDVGMWAREIRCQDETPCPATMRRGVNGIFAKMTRFNMKNVQDTRRDSNLLLCNTGIGCGQGTCRVSILLRGDENRMNGTDTCRDRNTLRQFTGWTLAGWTS